jgi:hypothetical protein
VIRSESTAGRHCAWAWEGENLDDLLASQET